MKKQIEAYWRAVVYFRKGGTLAFVFLGFFYCLSLFYRVGVQCRNFMYDTFGRLMIKKLPVQVVSVGNISMGGTGKTPAVITLAQRYRDKGKRVVVISRGYGRATEDTKDVIVASDGKDLRSEPAVAGDEPLLIADRVPGVPVLVCSDRVKAGKFAIQKFGADLLLLDDGFQHRRLARDVDMVVIDATVPPHLNKLFPCGTLREPFENVKRANVYIISRIDLVPDYINVAQHLKKINPKAKLWCAKHVPIHLVDIVNGGELPLATIKDKTVLMLSSVGNPEAFEVTIRGLECHIIEAANYPDHYVYNSLDMRQIMDTASGANADYVVTTEKDAVRLRPLLQQGMPVQVLALAIDMDIFEKAL